MCQDTWLVKHFWSWQCEKQKRHEKAFLLIYLLSNYPGKHSINSQPCHKDSQTEVPDVQCPYTSWWKIPRSDWPLPPKTFPRRLLKKHQGCGCAWNGFDASSTACVAPLAARRTHGDEAVPVTINSLIQHCPWSLTTFWERQGKWAASTK